LIVLFILFLVVIFLLILTPLWRFVTVVVSGGKFTPSIED